MAGSLQVRFTPSGIRITFLQSEHSLITHLHEASTELEGSENLAVVQKEFDEFITKLRVIVLLRTLTFADGVTPRQFLASNFPNLTRSS